MNMIDNTPTENKQNAKVKKAIERCQLDLQKDPNNAKLHIRLGDLYLQWHLDIFNSCQYIDEAITEYQRALESYIDSAEIYFKIGQAHFFKGERVFDVNKTDCRVSSISICSSKDV